MVRWSKWMGSVTVGLALAWQFTPALAQELSPSDEPTPAQLPEDDDAQAPADDSTDMSSDEQGDQRDDSSDAPAEMPIKPRAVDTSADPIDSDANDVAEEDGALEREVIKERFPDGTLRIEREVSQDDQGNYFNDGSWKAWDQRGNLIAEGEFARGRHVGPWVRWYRNVIEADMLQTPPYRFFPGPFISQANFEDGQLEGAGRSTTRERTRSVSGISAPVCGTVRPPGGRPTATSFARSNIATASRTASGSNGAPKVRCW